MGGIIGVLAATAVVILLERPNITNKWNKKETVLFFVSLLLGTSLCIAWVLDVSLLSLWDLTEDIYRPITEPFISYMKQLK